jgi:hypothetical protein
VATERGSYSELAVNRLEFGSDAGHCSRRAAGEVPLVWESGRELGGEADNCVSSGVSARRARVQTPARRAMQERCATPHSCVSGARVMSETGRMV